MGSTYGQRLIDQVVRRLQRDRRGFGERPCSFYTLRGSGPFANFVLRQPSVRALLPYESAGDLGDALSQGQQEELKELVDRVDRYGELVEGWSRGRSVAPACLAAVQGRLRFWSFRNVPDYCWQGLNPPEVVLELQTALERNIADYTYEEDLLAWAIPLLVCTLRHRLAEAARASRPGLDLDQLQDQLHLQARLCLGNLREVFGIHGIEAEEAVERTLLSLLRASEEEYRAHRERVSDWAVQRLFDQISLQIQFRLQPDVGPDWDLDPGKRALELRKRRRVLEAFYDMT